MQTSDRFRLPFRRRKQFEFTLMSYNLLSQDLLETHPELYRKCSADWLRWPERGHKIMQEIVDQQPDVICMQEAHSTHFDRFYRPQLERQGYGWQYKKRAGDKLDGCAICYKQDRFKLERHIELDLGRPALNPMLDRDNVAQICLLRPLVGEQREEMDNQLVIANTHLLYNPMRGDIKLAQLRLLLAELFAVSCRKPEAKRPKDRRFFPTLLCGDLNLVPFSPIHRFLEMGWVDLERMSCPELSGQMANNGFGRPLEPERVRLEGIDQESIFEPPPVDDELDDSKLHGGRGRRPSKLPVASLIRHPFEFVSAYKPRNNFDVDFMSSFTSDRHAIVDYIFYTKNSELRLLGLQKLPTVPQFIRSVKALPNETYGSDHFSISGRFSLSKQKQ